MWISKMGGGWGTADADDLKKNNIIINVKMLIRLEGGQTMWIGFLYVLGFFEGSFVLFNAYLVLFNLFLPKQK